jgi:hypothetical protein
MSKSLYTQTQLIIPNQHAEFSMSNKPLILSKSLKDICEWILAQFKAFPFSGADSPDGADIWVFTRYPGILLPQFLDCYATIDERMLLLPKPVNPSVEMLWRYTRFFPDEILGNTELLGQYAMTEERRLNGATRLCQKLLNPDS